MNKATGNTKGKINNNKNKITKYNKSMWFIIMWEISKGHKTFSIETVSEFDTLSCFQMGRHDEAWMVLKHIHDTNMRARGEPERVFTVSLNLQSVMHCPFISLVTTQGLQQLMV